MADNRKNIKRSTQVELHFLEALEKRTPQNARLLRALGDLYTRSGRHKAGLRVDEKLSALCPEENEVWYNLGCSYALAGRKDDAFDALNKAIELGYQDREWIVKDKDLEALRADPRFENLVNRVTGMS
jgi:Flp pilus assembly protein TadD